MPPDSAFTYGLINREYSLLLSVNGIPDIQAQTLNGISVQKVFF